MNPIISDSNKNRSQSDVSPRRDAINISFLKFVTQPEVIKLNRTVIYSSCFYNLLEAVTPTHSCLTYSDIVTYE